MRIATAFSFLAAIAVLVTAVSADPFVLYQTGWESAPATPAWGPGSVAPQNDWQSFANDPDTTGGHDVVINGTAQARVGAVSVTTPYGNQFHRFNASTSSTSPIRHLAWVDVTAAFDTRPGGLDLITSSLDLYVPSTQDQDDSTYGLVAYDATGAVFALFISPTFRTVYLDDLVTFRASAPDIFAYDQWFSLSIEANYQSGAIRALLDGTEIATLSGLNPAIVGGSLLDVDLYVENATGAPNPRSVFSDNFKITATSATPAHPALNIVPRGPDRYRISWPSSAADWILESTTALDGAEWAPTSEAVINDGSLLSVETTDAAVFRAFRLRQLTTP